MAVNATTTIPTDTERNIRYNVNHGVASILAVNLALPFFGIFALKLGASNFQVALLSSAPAFASLLVMFPGAMYVDRFSRKKQVTTMFFLANRVFYLLMACIPFLPHEWRAAALVVAVALMNLPGAVGNVAWQSFISRVIPPAQRAQAFARRNRWMNIVGTAAVVVAGRALDIMSFPVGYQVMFVLAFVAAMVEIRIFQQILEPAAPAEGSLSGDPAGLQPSASLAAQEGPGERGERAASHRAGWANGRHRRLISFEGSFWEALREIVGQPRFVRYTLAAMVFYFMWQIAWPLFTLYQVKVLGANNLWISLLNLANTGGSIVGYGFWAAFADRHGHLKTLVLSTLGIFIVPLYYAFSKDLTTITILNLATGAIFAGVNLSLFNALLEHTPDKHTTTYIAFYNTAVTLTTVFAPMVGVGLLKFFNFFWAFLICAAGRITGSLAFYVIMRLEAKADRLSARAGATPGGVTA